MGEDADYQHLWERIHAMPLRQQQTPYLGAAGDYYKNLMREDIPLQYERSAHLGFLEYSHRWLDQESFDKDQFHRMALEDALLAFPKLRHVVFGDFTSRARDSDMCPEDLARRLFKRAAQPDLLSNVQGYGFDDFWQILESIAACPTSGIRSISVGDGSPWRYPFGVDKFCGREEEPFHPVLPLKNFPLERWAQKDLAPYKQMFGTLHKLKLSLRFEHHSKDDLHERGLERSIIPQILSWSNNLVSRTFVSANSISTYDRQVMAEPGGKSHLTRTLFPLRFPSLSLIDLRGWEVEANELKGWLEKHASVLVQLRLVDNMLEGSMMSVAAWIGRAMSLTAVAYAPSNQRMTFEHPQLRGPPTPEDEVMEKMCQDLEVVMLQGRRNALFKSEGDWRRSREGLQIVDCL